MSWHQVLQGNYYYNIGDHGGVIVAVKYFKTDDLMFHSDPTVISKFTRALTRDNNFLRSKEIPADILDQVLKPKHQ